MATLAEFLNGEALKLRSIGDNNPFQIVSVRHKDYMQMDMDNAMDYVIDEKPSLEMKAWYNSFGIKLIFKKAGYTFFLKIID